MKQKINLRVERYFSETISTTFDFLRYNFKMIMTLMIKIPGPLILFAMLLIIPYYIDFYDTTSNSLADATSGGLPDLNMSVLSLLGVGVVVFFIAAILSMASVNEFIALYQNSDTPEMITVKEVYARVKNNFWRYLGAYFLVGLIVMAGFFVFIIPGIYFAIALLLTFPIITVEKKGVTDAIRRSFKLIKGNWWATFGLLIVLSILTTFITYVFVIPIGMIAGVLLLNPELGWFASFLYALINSFTFIITFFVSVIYYIAINIKYFSLVEQKEQAGLKEQIEKMNAVEITKE